MASIIDLILSEQDTKERKKMQQALVLQFLMEMLAEKDSDESSTTPAGEVPVRTHFSPTGG